MPTQNEIYERALTRLNRLGEGQTATGSQVAVMERNLNSLHAYLERKEYIEYDIDDIPEEDGDSFVTLLALRSALDFSTSQERIALLKMEEPRAMQVLMANNQCEYDEEPVEAKYY